MLTGQAVWLGPTHGQALSSIFKVHQYYPLVERSGHALTKSMPMSIDPPTLEPRARSAGLPLNRPTPLHSYYSVAYIARLYSDPPHRP
jgi:hypothetical protein